MHRTNEKKNCVKIPASNITYLADGEDSFSSIRWYLPTISHGVTPRKQDSDSLSKIDIYEAILKVLIMTLQNYKEESELIPNTPGMLING